MIDIEKDGQGVMSGPSLTDLEVDPRGQPKRTRSMSQIMRSDPFEVRRNRTTVWGNGSKQMPFGWSPYVVVEDRDVVCIAIVREHESVRHGILTMEIDVKPKKVYESLGNWNSPTLT